MNYPNVGFNSKIVIDNYSQKTKHKVSAIKKFLHYMMQEFFLIQSVGFVYVKHKHYAHTGIIYF